MNCVINALILPLQFFFKNKVRYVHQLQSGNLRNQITKLPIRKVNGKIFSYSTVVARIKIQKNFISYFCNSSNSTCIFFLSAIITCRQCILRICSSSLLIQMWQCTCYINNNNKTKQKRMENKTTEQKRFIKARLQYVNLRLKRITNRLICLILIIFFSLGLARAKV